MVRFACLERLFVVLFAFIVFSALPGVAPLVAAYGHTAPDGAYGGRTHLAAAADARHTARPSVSSPDQMLQAWYDGHLSAVLSHAYDTDELLAIVYAATRNRHDLTVASVFRSAPVGVPTASYDAQGPPVA